MPSHLLKFSALLILSQFVFLSEQLQPCLGTTKPRPSDDYTFALAQMDNFNNPLGPQEACYYSCGAQVVTQSANRGDFNRLTLMDNAASFLTSSGFLKVGESYFLNHLGMEDAEGGNGIGCIEVKPGNKLTHYPKTHPVCSMAKAAVCGFWGQQSIPSAPNQLPPPPPPTTTPKIPLPQTSVEPVVKPKPTSKPKNPPKPKPTAVKTTPVVKPPPIVATTKPVVVINTSSPIVPVVPLSSSAVVTSSVEAVTTSPAIVDTPLPASTSTTELSEILPEIETIPDILPIIDEPHPTPLIEPEQPDMTFKVNGRNFHVINKYENSLAAAGLTCQQNRATIATVTSQSYQDVASTLKNMVQSRVIIGSWNGDSYSLTGNSCLLLQVDHGIFPGTCADASAILCQS